MNGWGDRGLDDLGWIIVDQWSMDGWMDGCLNGREDGYSDGRGDGLFGGREDD